MVALSRLAKAIGAGSININFVNIFFVKFMRKINKKLK